MLSLLSRRPRPRTVPAPSFRPMLETLEDRYTPTTTLSLNVAYGAGKNVILSGNYAPEGTPFYIPQASNQTIKFSGVVNGSAITDSNGNYSVQLLASGLGNITARDANGLSDPVTKALYDAAPVLLSFEIVKGPDEYWILRGTVSYRNTDNLVITFGGGQLNIDGKTTEVNYEGSFSVAVELSGTPEDEGTVSAKTISPWGTVSNILYDIVHQTGV